MNRHVDLKLVFLTVFVVFFGACKMRQSSSLKADQQAPLDYGYTEEIIPFNRVPLSVLQRDDDIFRQKGWPMPEIQKAIQVYRGVEYGIRLISEEDIQKFVRPGDIAVDYSPIDNPQNLVFESKIYGAAQKSNGEKPEPGEVGLNHMILVGLGERGMSHAKLVIKHDERLCHIDSPEVMSDCKWEGFTHFFRVDTDEIVRKKVEEMAEQIILKAPAYSYDSFLFTDVYVKGVAAVQKHMHQFQAKQQRSLPPLYCSELPFTLYSVAMGKNLFETGFNMMDFAKQIAELRSEPKFAPFVNNEIMQQSLSAFVQQASTVPENVRPMIATGIKQLLSEGYVGSGLRYLVKSYYPPLVLPQHFMTAATNPQSVPGTRIVYIGSVELPELKKTPGYFSSLIVSTGKQAIKNYFERVQEWWNSPAPPRDPGEFMLHSDEQEEANPRYLEPDYSP